MRRTPALVVAVIVLFGAVMAVGAAPTTSTTVTVSGEQLYNPVTDEGDGTTEANADIILAGDGLDNQTVNSSITFTDPPDTIDQVVLWVNGTSGADYDFNVTVYGGNETADGTYGVQDADTTNITTFVPAFQTGKIVVPLPGNQTGAPYTLEFVTNNSTVDNQSDALLIDTDTSAGSVQASVNGTTVAKYVNATVYTPPHNQTITDSDSAQYIWTEHVNVTHQFTYRWANLTVEVPFTRSNVTAVHRMAWGVNTSTLTTVTPSFYDTNDTARVTLTTTPMTTLKPEVTISTIGRKVTTVHGDVVIGPEQNETATMNHSFKPTSVTGWFGLDLEEADEEPYVYDTNTSGSFEIPDDVVRPNASAGTWTRVYRTNVTATVTGGSVEVEVTNDTAPWRNVTLRNYTSTVTVTSLDVTEPGWNNVSVSDEADAVAMTNLTVGDGEPDMAVTAANGSEVVVTVGQLTPGKEMLVLDSRTGEPLDQGKVQEDGDLEFTVTANSTEYIELQYGLQLQYGAFTVNPVITEDRLVRGATVTRTIAVTNEINESYRVNVTETVDWMTLNRTAFVLSPNETEMVSFNLSSTRVAPGSYHTEIVIEGHNTTGTTDVYMAVLPALGGGIPIPFFGVVQFETLLLVGAVAVILVVGGLYYYQTRKRQASAWR